jgi:hypothetical protein
MFMYQKMAANKEINGVSFYVIRFFRLAMTSVLSRIQLES